MGRLARLPWGLVLVACLHAAPPVESRGRIRVAILPLRGEGTGHFGKPDADVHQRITSAFLRTRRFELVERQRLDAVLEEAKLQQGGLVDDSTAVQLGRLLGAQQVLVGSYRGEIIAYYGEEKTSNPLFRWFTGKVSAGLRLVDVASGRISETFEVAGAEKDTTAAKTFHGLLEDFTRKLEREVGNRYPLAGVLLREEPDRQVMVDLGRKDGLKVGDVYQAVAFGPDVVHPTTGRLLRGPRRVLADLKVTSLDEESCLMKVTGGREPLNPGLLVESVPRKAGMFEKLMDKVK